MVEAEPVGPLHGIRVVEMGTHVAGPFAGQLLGDFGAEVIKVEQPGAGDPMREWGTVRPQGLGLWWPILARNKKSVTIDLRRPEGQQLARRLVVETADVLLENFRPGTLEKWGLGPDDLRAERPDLIVARVSGYGQTGPYARRAGFGSIGEAMGGIRHLTGFPDRAPSRVGVSLGDALAGVFTALGVTLSLLERERGRESRGERRGQVVDVAIYEAVLALMESLLPDYQLGNHIRGRTGSVLPNVAPSNLYETADGVLVLIAANADAPFRRLAEVMGQPDLADDERYATHLARGDHADELDMLIENWTRRFSAADLVELLSAAGVPAGRIYTAAEMLDDPHFAARDAILSVDHPTLGEFPMQAPCPRLSVSPGSVRSLGPEHGEHNDEVFQDLLGLSSDELQRLRRDGIVAAQASPLSMTAPTGRE